MSARRANPEPAIGVIGGSGLYEMDGLEDIRWIKIKTPFGDPSDAYCTGHFGGRRVIFLPRHGRGHRLTPSELNYRANIYGMKMLGAHALLSISAVGSMKQDIHPLELVVPDQFYDHTKRRVSTFFGDGIPCTTSSFTEVHRGGTYICIEGPQFSTKGESEIYRRWGVSVIGMTNMPEAKLAREAELCYATLALVTDYDVWHEEHEAVTVEAVVANLMKNVATAKEVLRRVIALVPRSCSQGCPEALGSAVITDPKAFPPRARKKLALLLDRHFPPGPRDGRRG